MVKVIGGEFEGVIGKIARIAGQQRMVVEVTGLCLVATAYIPSMFIERIIEQYVKNKLNHDENISDHYAAFDAYVCFFVQERESGYATICG